MTTLKTDSKALNHFLFGGINAADTPLRTAIDLLNDTILNAAKLRVAVEYESPESIRARIDDINLYAVDILNQLEALNEDLAPLVNQHFASQFKDEVFSIDFGTERRRP